MIIGIPKETLAGEKRLAASPKSVQALIKMGFDICIESNAGEYAKFSDTAFTEAGATIADTTSVWQSDLVLKLNAPTPTELTMMKSGATLVSFFAPAQNSELIEQAK